MADCQLCARPQTADQAYICGTCAGKVTTRLEQAADLWPELLTTCASQARMAEPGPHRRGRAPAEPVRPGIGGQDQANGWPHGLPPNLAAVETRDAVRNTVTTWVRLAAEERGTIEPIGTTPTLLRWLAGQCEWLRHQRYAAVALDELGYAAGRVEPAVDRPKPRVDAGECGSPTDVGSCRQRLSATPAAAYVHCPACRATWSAIERSTLILEAATDVLGTAAEISAWLTIHGEPVPEATIRSWAHRRRLLRHGTDPDGGAPRYRLGDVRRLASERQPGRERIGA